MQQHPEREEVSQRFATDDGYKAGDPRRACARPAAAPRASAIAPVHYLRGEATLRTYRAQCDQCLALYDRGRAEGLYGRAGAADAFPPGDDLRSAPGYALHPRTGDAG